MNSGMGQDLKEGDGARIGASAVPTVDLVEPSNEDFICLE